MRARIVSTQRASADVLKRPRLVGRLSVGVRTPALHRPCIQQPARVVLAQGKSDVHLEKHGVQIAMTRISERHEIH